MNGDRTVTDEQGAGDLPVAVALDQQSEHVTLAIGEVEPGPGRSSRRGGGYWRTGPAGNPGPAGEVCGQAEGGNRVQPLRKLLTGR
jgi:hypothetical protein